MRIVLVYDIASLRLIHLQFHIQISLNCSGSLTVSADPIQSSVEFTPEGLAMSGSGNNNISADISFFLILIFIQ
jgi:hypothetical protein